MHDLLDQIPSTINKFFDVLDLLVVRLTLLALSGIGAYHAIKRHR